MARKAGKYRITKAGGEEVRAFIPSPLPPIKPAFQWDDELISLHTHAEQAIGRLQVAGMLVPSTKWFLYGFVRKEAVISSQIEGTQATLEDVIAYEATNLSNHPADIEEVCNYVDALTFAREELQAPRGLPISTRLLCKIHMRLMAGTRGMNKQPGKIRSSQNWIGGTRPGNARFVPPPPDALGECLGAFEKWLHGRDPLPPLIKAGLAHVQFETIHPFLDGNGRIGRMLITLLVENWGLMDQPFLYLSLPFKQHREEYYHLLNLVRTNGDWEGWIRFFLKCVAEAAEDGVSTAQRLFAITTNSRQNLVAHPSATVNAIRLLEALPDRPIFTLPMAIEMLGTSKPTASHAIKALSEAGILKEITGKKRDRAYAYQAYLDVLAENTELL